MVCMYIYIYEEIVLPVQQQPNHQQEVMMLARPASKLEMQPWELNQVL